MPGAPFNPTTGEHAPLSPFPARGTTLGLFQVIGDDPTDPDTADTHDNYVVCRGYESESDPEHQFLHDPYTAESTTPIMVAKPYGVRGTFPYEQGQVIVAARIRNKLGYNAGKAETTVGQPEDLDEEVVLLTDDDDVGISWLDVGTPSEPDYDIGLGTWVGNIDACPLTPALALGGAAGVFPTMPSVANFAPRIINPANNAQFGPLGPVGTLYNPLPFAFNGASDEYWVTHLGDGNWLLRGPASKIIGGIYTTTGTTLTGGAVNWATTDGNTSPYMGSVAKVDGASPTTIEWTAKGSRTYLFTLRIQVLATSSFITNRNSSTVAFSTIAGGGAGAKGAPSQQIDIYMDTALGGSGVTFDHVLSGTMTGDVGDKFKITVTMFGATVTGVGGQLSLVAMVPRP